MRKFRVLHLSITSLLCAIMTTLISYCRFTLWFAHFTPYYRNRSRVRDLTSHSQRFATRMNTSSMSHSNTESAAANSQNDAARGEIPSDSVDVLVQYVVLRRDLIDTWPMGSVVTQGCHASVSAIWENKDDPHTLQYCSPQNIDSMHKVTLEVKGEVQMLNLSEKLTAGGIVHKLWIEHPENFPTSLATKPYPKSVVAPLFKKLKLCK